MKTHHNFILIASLVFLLDRFSKQLILLFNQEIYIFNCLIIQLRQNYGIALGIPFFIDSLFWPTILILGLLAIYFKRKIILKSPDKKGIIGLGLIIGGAAGNIFDRLAFGYIIDFINIPFFNLIINFADMGIISGAVLAGSTILENRNSAALNKF